MSEIVKNITETNLRGVTTAAILEAGFVANKQISKMVASKAPMMVRGYLDTPLGRLLVANAAQVASRQFRPGDERLTRLTNAMVTSAYQDVIREIDINGMIDSLLEDSKIAGCMDRLSGWSEEDGEVPPKKSPVKKAKAVTEY